MKPLKWTIIIDQSPSPTLVVDVFLVKFILARSAHNKRASFNGKKERERERERERVLRRRWMEGWAVNQYQSVRSRRTDVNRCERAGLGKV